MATGAHLINLMLVDDHAMFRQALSQSLGSESGFTVVGQFGSFAEALASLDESGATMVLLDVNLGRERALDFVLECRKKDFKGRVLIITAGTSGQEAVQLVQAGVGGIIHKHHSTAELCQTIRQVAAGEVYLEPAYVASLYRSVERTKWQHRSLLTERDKLVLRFIMQGMTNREIAARLKITESGVKSSLRQLFDKLGVRTRAQLVKIALEKYHDQL